MSNTENVIQTALQTFMNNQCCIHSAVGYSVGSSRSG